MNIWQGVDIRTHDTITIHDAPLRVVVGVSGAQIFNLSAICVKRMAIATSVHLGTAAVIHLQIPGDDAIVVEAVPQECIYTKRANAALRAAHEAIQRETDLERVWNDESARTDELLYRVLHGNFRGIA